MSTAWLPVSGDWLEACAVELGYDFEQRRRESGAASAAEWMNETAEALAEDGLYFHPVWTVWSTNSLWDVGRWQTVAEHEEFVSVYQ